MHGFRGERTLMRIHLGERDRHHGLPLYQAIVELLRARHYAGATVYRAVMGFGANARLRSDRIELLSLDLPIVVEVVETEERIQEILPELDEMIQGGLVFMGGQRLNRTRCTRTRGTSRTPRRTRAANRSPGTRPTASPACRRA